MPVPAPDPHKCSFTEETAYACLIDKDRTEALRRTILEVVKAKDTVLELGSGSGILALFAATAGAKKVHCIEIDSLLAENLVTTIEANGMEKVITVTEGNAMSARLPRKVDVVIAEMIGTALLEEMQIPVINRLHSKGVITKATKVIPSGYETFVELVDVDNTFYGYQINIPIYDWPNYSNEETGWTQFKLQSVSEPHLVGKYDFRTGAIDPEVDRVIEFNVPDRTAFNAFRLTGTMHLGDSTTFGASNSVNGDLVIPIGRQVRSGLVRLHLRFTMGGGLHSLRHELS